MAIYPIDPDTGVCPRKISAFSFFYMRKFIINKVLQEKKNKIKLKALIIVSEPLSEPQKLEDKVEQLLTRKSKCIIFSWFHDF